MKMHMRFFAAALVAGFAAAPGLVTVQTFPNASLLPSRQEISGAVQNQVQMILPFVSFYEAVSPKAGIFTMPMLFRDYEHLQKAAEGPVGKAVSGGAQHVAEPAIGKH